MSTGYQINNQSATRFENDPRNDAMLKRLEEIESGKISATCFDKGFYTLAPMRYLISTLVF